jgi:hypothetical protein
MFFFSMVGINIFVVHPPALLENVCARGPHAAPISFFPAAEIAPMTFGGKVARAVDFICWRKARLTPGTRWGARAPYVLLSVFSWWSSCIALLLVFFIFFLCLADRS